MMQMSACAAMSTMPSAADRPLAPARPSQEMSRAIAALTASAVPSTARITHAMSQDAVQAAVALVRTLQVTSILELGSGHSTVELAKAIADRPQVSFWSLDHSPEWCRRTSEALSKEGLEARVRLVCSPIKLQRAGAFVGRWYDRSVLPPGLTFDFVVIDGPPSRRVGRFMALPMLWPNLVDQSVLLLDDASRPKLEKVWLDLWKGIYGPCLDIRVYDEFQKGLALMIKSDGPLAPVSMAVWARHARNALMQALRTVRYTKRKR